jgi:putative transposase
LKPAELETVHVSVNRGRPFGDEPWVAKTARRLGLMNTLRDPGRPKKKATIEAERVKRNQ